MFLLELEIKNCFKKRNFFAISFPSLLTEEEILNFAPD